MTKFNKIDILIGTIITIIFVLGLGCFLGFAMGSLLRSGESEAEITDGKVMEEHEDHIAETESISCIDQQAFLSTTTGRTVGYAKVYIYYKVKDIDSVQVKSLWSKWMGMWDYSAPVFGWGTQNQNMPLFQMTLKDGYEWNDETNFAVTMYYTMDYRDVDVEDYTRWNQKTLSLTRDEDGNFWSKGAFTKQGAGTATAVVNLSDSVFTVSATDYEIGGYYTDGTNYYELTNYSETDHYHCTNGQHSGNNDYTTNPITGTCYTTNDRAGWTQAYYGHSCSAQYGEHNVSTSTNYGPHLYRYTKKIRYPARTKFFFNCAYCGAERIRYSTESSSTAAFEEGTCGSNVSYTYTCTICGTSNNSGISGICYSNITGYKCSYCQQTFSSNTTADCSSRGWKKCNVCSGNWDACSCTVLNNHNHTTEFYYTQPFYTWRNIDTNATHTNNTLYTKATSYNIAFNINNSNATGTGTTGGSMANQFMLHGHSKALTSNAFTFTNHRFLGWSTSATATSATYSNGQSVSFTTSNVASGGTLTLYAIWKYQITKPTGTTTQRTYNSSDQSPVIANVNTTYMNVSGTQTAKNVGNYSITYTLKDKNKTEWTDATTTDVSIAWSIIKLSLTIPTVSGTFTYDGTQKSATVTNMNSTYITQGGSATGTNAQTYTITFTLKDTANTQWSGGSTAVQSKTWTISPRNINGATVTLPQTDYIYDGSAKQPDPTVSV